jgi:hypothetical protein
MRTPSFAARQLSGPSSRPLPTELGAWQRRDSSQESVLIGGSERGVALLEGRQGYWSRY